jgi:hypothetical protein
MSNTPSITERVKVIKALPPALLGARPPFPRSVKIELTSRCDFHCYFCASHRRPRHAQDMSPQLYRRLASRLRGLGVDQLGLSYIGESFLCEWLPEAITYAKDVCQYPYVFLTTNGLSATPARVRDCILARLDSLKFAFNWSSPDQFQAVTGRSFERFHAVFANLATARCIRDEVEQTTGHRCALYASSLAYDEVQRDRMARVVGDIEPLVDEHYWLPFIGNRGLPGEDEPRPMVARMPPCPTLFTEAHITVDGQLSACCLDASPRFHMGDLQSDTLTYAWHSSAFQALRRAHLKGDLSGTVCAECIGY